MTKKSKKSIIAACLIAIVLIITSIIDCLINYGKINPLIYVSENYIHSVFAAVVTITTLSISIFSLIVSIADSSIMGLKLKDIISFKASPIKMKQVILFTVIVTILSAIVLSLNMNTTMSFIVVVSIIYIGYVSSILYKMVVNDNFTKNIIQNEFDENIDYSMYVVKWLNEYKKAIMDNNNHAINLYSQILSFCLENNKKSSDNNNNNITSIIQSYISKLFKEACNYTSFVKAFYLVFCFNGKCSYHNFDYDRICDLSIHNIQYYTEEQLNSLNFSGTINNILYSDLDNNLKVKFIYYYFDAMINSSVNAKIKIRILEKGLNEISSIYHEEYDFVKCKVLLKIFANNVIVGENFDLSKKVFEKIIKSLYLKNLFNHNVIYISIIANIFRCIYFYGFINYDVLNDVQRKNIKALASYRFQLDGLTQLSIDKLCISCDEEILDYYINELLYGDSIYMSKCDEKIARLMKEIRIEDLFYTTQDTFELGRQYMLWSSNKNVDFIFLYFFSRSLNKVFPLFAHADDFIKNNPEQKIKVYEIYCEILKLFNENDKTLYEYSIKQLNNFRLFKGEEGLSDIFYKSKAEKYFSDIKMIIDSMDTAIENVDIDSKDLFEEIDNINFFKDICDVDDSIQLHSVVPCQVICPIDWDKPKENGISQIRYLFEQKFWETLDKSVLTFGGSEHKYSWLKENNIKVNYKIIGVKKNKPSNMQIEAYIDTKRVANNQIMIDGELYTYQKAKEHIENIKAFLTITLKIKVERF